MVTGKPAKKPRRTKTKTVKKTLHPVWEEKEVVWANIQDNIEELALQVTIFDADMVTNDTLGEATVPAHVRQGGDRNLPSPEACRQDDKRCHR